MEVKMPTICYVNMSEKAELTTLIRHIGKFAILFFIEIDDNKILQPILQPLLTFGHRGNMKLFINIG